MNVNGVKHLSRKIFYQKLLFYDNFVWSLLQYDLNNIQGSHFNKDKNIIKISDCYKNKYKKY